MVGVAHPIHGAGRAMSPDDGKPRISAPAIVASLGGIGHRNSVSLRVYRLEAAEQCGSVILSVPCDEVKIDPLRERVGAVRGSVAAGRGFSLDLRASLDTEHSRHAAVGLALAVDMVSSSTPGRGRIERRSRTARGTTDTLSSANNCVRWRDASCSNTLPRLRREMMLSANDQFSTDFPDRPQLSPII
jgi:hypothetical protein